MSAPVQKLTEQHKVFVAHYLATFKVIEAAEKAGCTPKSARSQGSRWLAAPVVQAYIAEQVDKLLRPQQIEAARILDELAICGLSNITDYVKWDEHGLAFHVPSDDIPKRLLAAVKKVKSKVTTTTRTYEDHNEEDVRVELELELHSKDAALDKLARHLGLLNQGFPNEWETPEGQTFRAVALLPKDPLPPDPEDADGDHP